MDADELLALFLARPGTVLGDLGLDRASESALTKLLLALPAADRQDLARARRKVLVDLSTWRPAEVERMPCLAVLYDAIWRDRQVHVAYVRADGRRVERDLDPLGLVAKGQTWYLVGTEGHAEPRTYRVSRITTALVRDTPARDADGFDLQAYWDASKARLVAGVPRFAVRLRVQADILGRLGGGRWSRVVSIARPDPDGWTAVEMEFELEDDACAFVLGLGARIELREPERLRRQIASEVAAAGQLYDSDREPPRFKAR